MDVEHDGSINDSNEKEDIEGDAFIRTFEHQKETLDSIYWEISIQDAFF